jgi:hypothetical protein
MLFLSWLCFGFFALAGPEALNIVAVALTVAFHAGHFAFLIGALPGVNFIAWVSDWREWSGVRLRQTQPQCDYTRGSRNTGWIGFAKSGAALLLVCLTRASTYSRVLCAGDRSAEHPQHYGNS